MAIALVILVAIDTFLTGWTLARVRELTPRVQVLDHDADKMREAIETNARMIEDLGRSVDG